MRRERWVIAHDEGTGNVVEPVPLAAESVGRSTTMTRRHLYALLVPLPGVAFYACGGSSNGGAPCGDGTMLRQGHCVSADSGSSDGSVSDATSDSTQPSEAGPEADAAPDRAGETSADGDGGGSQADPCPTTQPILDCDTVCWDGGGEAACTAASCGFGPITLPNQGQSFVIRTPDAPGQDQRCTSGCPGSGFAYGVGIKVPGTGPAGAITITVGAPWEIVYGGDPYCDYYDAGQGAVFSGCISGYTQGGDTYYVMTKDPSAPARNITITISAQPVTCPPDGGV